MAAFLEQFLMDVEELPEELHQSYEKMREIDVTTRCKQYFSLFSDHYGCQQPISSSWTQCAATCCTSLSRFHPTRDDVAFPRSRSDRVGFGCFIPCLFRKRLRRRWLKQIAKWSSQHNLMKQLDTLFDARSTVHKVDKHIRNLDRLLKKMDQELGTQAGELLSALLVSLVWGSQNSAAYDSTCLLYAWLRAIRMEDMPVDPNEPLYCLCHNVFPWQVILILMHA